MQPSVVFTRIWSDDDLTELEIAVCDGSSIFRNQLYVYPDQLRQTVKDLKAFRLQIHGGVLDLEFGSFGPEYANGAFHARLHFPDGNKLFVTCRQQHRFIDFAKKNIAAEATLYLVSTTASLDRFVSDFAALTKRKAEEAVLRADS